MERKTNVSVKVKDVDMEGGHLTVQTPEGKEVSLKVDDRDRLRKVKPGDVINVTYTEAFLVSLDQPQGAPKN
jgi:translation initiation factor IF-1